MTHRCTPWLALLALLPLTAFAGDCEPAPRHALLVHGGFLDYEEEVGEPHRRLLREVLGHGQRELAAGRPALDVVEQAIATMEDSGLLDAGKGSIVNTEGFTETDASLMDGASGRSGAVAAMQRLRNPIRAARLVMERTRHVLFAGGTGEATLIGLGAATIDPASYYTPPPPPPAPPPAASRHGTVGAVALDRCGRIAAGTSTGGWPGKLPGRIGDSPVVGASTWADARLGLSATGVGEHFIRRTATRDIAARVAYRGDSLQAATRHVVNTLIGGEDKASGAVIALSVDGEVVVVSNGYGILWGAVRSDEPVSVGTRGGLIPPFADAISAPGPNATPRPPAT